MKSNTTDFFSEPTAAIDRNFYHITERSSVSSILQNGLKPQLGHNSMICKEKLPVICLTDAESIPYWLLLLAVKDPVLVKVQVAYEPEKISYSEYSEYLVFKDIPSDVISLADQSLLHRDISIVQKDLCKSYMYSMCFMCVRIIRAYAKNDLEEDDFNQVCTFLNIIDRLDFSCYTQNEWRDIISDFGSSGEYTICDKSVERVPLWARILMYPEDQYTEVRMRLSRTIQTLFYGCLDLNTGGMTE